MPPAPGKEGVARACCNGEIQTNNACFTMPNAMSVCFERAKMPQKVSNQRQKNKGPISPPFIASSARHAKYNGMRAGGNAAMSVVLECPRRGGGRRYRRKSSFKNAGGEACVRQQGSSHNDVRRPSVRPTASSSRFVLHASQRWWWCC